MHDNTVLTAADVRRIVRHAKAAGLNQQLSNELAIKLDPDGFSIMSIADPHHDPGNGSAHHRVNAFFKVRGQAAAEEVLMDVLASDWDKLPEATEGNTVSKDALRNLTRKWIARMNHPQLSKNPQAQYAYEGCIIDLQELIRDPLG
jgi:hypothetical protein